VELIVARIGRPHGLGGEVSLELRTDIPEERLAIGAILKTDPPSAGPLTVTATRQQAGLWYARFAETTDRTAAESLRGILLVINEDASREADAWYPSELVGLKAERPDGREVGTVVAVDYLPAQDLLVVREPSGAESRIPFVTALVPVVDVAGGKIVVDPPFGLLAGEEVDDVKTDGEEVDDAD
jgi:16S rRNA processing protein RimM